MDTALPYFIHFGPIATRDADQALELKENLSRGCYSYPKIQLGERLGAAKNPRTSRKHLGVLSLAACDLSDVRLPLQQKQEDNILRLDWKDFSKGGIISIDEGGYDFSDIIFKVILDALEKSAKALQIQQVDEAWFNERADRWEKEAGIHSAPGARFAHRDYINILAKGPQVAPFILKRLKKSKRDWCWALERMFDPEDPGKDINNYEGKVNAWLEWGKKKNIV